MDAIKASRTEAIDAAKALRNIIPIGQMNQFLQVLTSSNHPDRQFFFDKFVHFASIFHTMPTPTMYYAIKDDTMVYLHYYNENMDWYITEKDDLDEQDFAFGIVDLGLAHGGIKGPISIKQLIDNGVILDMFFEPTPTSNLRKRNIRTSNEDAPAIFPEWIRIKDVTL